MSRGKINFFNVSDKNVLDKCECWKEECVKSVFGQFSSGVSICPYKRLQ